MSISAAVMAVMAMTPSGSKSGATGAVATEGLGG